MSAPLSPHLPDELVAQLAPRPDDDEITRGFLEGVREVLAADADIPRPELELRGLLADSVSVG